MLEFRVTDSVIEKSSIISFPLQTKSIHSGNFRDSVYLSVIKLPRGNCSLNLLDTADVIHREKMYYS